MRIRESEVTDESLFLSRREVLRLGAVTAIGATLAGCPAASEAEAATGNEKPTNAKLEGVLEAPERFRVDDDATSYSDATTYNNFYEFGTGKRDPSSTTHAAGPSGA